MHPPSADRPSGGAGRFLQFSGLVRPDSARQPDAPESSLPPSQAAADTLAAVPAWADQAAAFTFSRQACSSGSV